MGKKKKNKQKIETPKPAPAEPKTVRVETAAIIALIALVVGFFGGELVRLSKTPARPPMPPPGATPGPPAGMPQRSPADTIPTPAQASKILELEREVAARPGNVAAWTDLGHYYFDTDQFEKSIKAYKKSLELSPYNANVWTDMGVMYRRSGKPLEAIAAFEKAMEIDPKHEVSRFNKGIVLMSDLDNIEGALAAWEDLLTINPQAKAPNGDSIKAMVERFRAKQNQP